MQSLTYNHRKPLQYSLLYSTILSSLNTVSILCNNNDAVGSESCKHIIQWQLWKSGRTNIIIIITSMRSSEKGSCMYRKEARIIKLKYFLWTDVNIEKVLDDFAINTRGVHLYGDHRRQPPGGSGYGACGQTPYLTSGKGSTSPGYGRAQTRMHMTCRSSGQIFRIQGRWREGFMGKQPRIFLGSHWNYRVYYVEQIWYTIFISQISYIRGCKRSHHPVE